MSNWILKYVDTTVKKKTGKMNPTPFLHKTYFLPLQLQSVFKSRSNAKSSQKYQTGLGLGNQAFIIQVNIACS